MKKIFLLSLLTFVCHWTTRAQAVYVDCNTGSDKNLGTKESPVYSINKAAEIINSMNNDIYVMKINPGIYILNKHVPVATQKSMSNKRIVIEASILPDDPSWTPEKMPVIKSISSTGEIMLSNFFLKDYWITSFYINESHVTIRGLKFLGHSYPRNIFYPISRFDTSSTDLEVEQCMFLGDLQSSVIQVAVIARGNSVKVDHCIFYNANNAVVLYGDKPGNSITNCIIYGASECAIWTVNQNSNFTYKHNIVSDCNYFWLYEGPSKYTVDSSIIVNNKNYQGVYSGNKLVEVEPGLIESNVTKEGNISIRLINTIWEPWPIDHLHVIPGTLGYDLGAGLFKHRKQ